MTPGGQPRLVLWAVVRIEKRCGHVHMLFESLLVYHLLPSHWLKQIAWLGVEPVWALIVISVPYEWMEYKEQGKETPLAVTVISGADLLIVGKAWWAFKKTNFTGMEKRFSQEGEELYAFGWWQPKKGRGDWLIWDGCCASHFPLSGVMPPEWGLMKKRPQDWVLSLGAAKE